MKIYLLLLISLLSSELCLSQSDEKNSIEVSMPVIFNNSNGVFYSLGNRREPSGKAISYGLGLNYYRYINKNFFFKTGLAYFKQSFNVKRPFDFNGDTVTNLLYSTKKYLYHCVGLNAGFGYAQKLSEKLKLNGSVSLNFLNSFSQSYTPGGYSGFEHKKVQSNNMNFSLGSLIIFSLGSEYVITSKISLGTSILFPISTKWKEDNIFIDSQFGSDAQIVAENRFSIGTALSCKYHF